MQTSDIGLAAAFAVFNIHPTSTSTKAGRMSWTFSDSPDLDVIRDAYFSGRLEGSLLAYNTTIRMFQAQLKGGR